MSYLTRPQPTQQEIRLYSGDRLRAHLRDMSDSQYSQFMQETATQAQKVEIMNVYICNVGKSRAERAKQQQPMFSSLVGEPRGQELTSFDRFQETKLGKALGVLRPIITYIGLAALWGLTAAYLYNAHMGVPDIPHKDQKVHNSIETIIEKPNPNEELEVILND